MNNNSFIYHPKLTIIFFACLVNKLGGEVKITQADIDEVGFNTLAEEGLEDGSLKLTLIKRKQSS